MDSLLSDDGLGEEDKATDGSLGDDFDFGEDFDEGFLTTEKKTYLVSLRDEFLPDWVRKLPEGVRVNYLKAPKCKICNLQTPNNKPLRSEVELMVIEGKTYEEIGAIIQHKYGLKISPANISSHMTKHAHNFAEVVQNILSSELGKVLDGTIPNIVDQYKVLLIIMQVGLHGILEDPSKVSVRDVIMASEKFHIITEGLDLRHHGDVTQEDITAILDIIQNIMTPDQIMEARKRFVMMKEYMESRGLPEGGAPFEEDDNIRAIKEGVIVGGEVEEAEVVMKTQENEASEPEAVSDNGGDVVIGEEYITPSDIPTLEDTED